MPKLTHLLPKDTYDPLKVVEIFQTIQQLTELNKWFYKQNYFYAW